MEDCPLPYLKWWPADWLSDRTVRMMSPAARGIYFDLLNVAWKEGGIPADPSELAGWLGMKPRAFARVWEEIEPLFVHGTNGFLVNPRMEQERKEAQRIYRKRVESGRKGGRPPKQTESGQKTVRKANG